MRMRDCVGLVVVLFLAMFTVGCSKSEPPKTEAPASAPAASPLAEGKTLFEQKCSVCHGLDRATVRKETKEKWASIVKDMQGRKADWISDADAGKIVEFLASEHGKK
jgi:mono/diheme cytochrome c family protein